MEMRVIWGGPRQRNLSLRFLGYIGRKRLSSAGTGVFGHWCLEPVSTPSEEQSQAEYLHAIRNQLGTRLSFWMHLIVCVNRKWTHLIIENETTLCY